MCWTCPDCGLSGVDTNHLCPASLAKQTVDQAKVGYILPRQPPKLPHIEVDTSGMTTEERLKALEDRVLKLELSRAPWG